MAVLIPPPPPLAVGGQQDQEPLYRGAVNKRNRTEREQILLFHPMLFPIGLGGKIPPGQAQELPLLHLFKEPGQGEGEENGLPHPVFPADLLGKGGRGVKEVNACPANLPEETDLLKGKAEGLLQALFTNLQKSGRDLRYQCLKLEPVLESLLGTPFLEYVYEKDEDHHRQPADRGKYCPNEAPVLFIEREGSVDQRVGLWKVADIDVEPLQLFVIEGVSVRALHNGRHVGDLFAVENLKAHLRRHDPLVVGA